MEKIEETEELLSNEPPEQETAANETQETPSDFDALGLEDHLASPDHLTLENHQDLSIPLDEDIIAILAESFWQTPEEEEEEEENELVQNQFEEPNAVDLPELEEDIDFLLTGSLLDIDVEEISDSEIQQLDYDAIFGDSETQPDNITSQDLLLLGQDLENLTLGQLPEQEDKADLHLKGAVFDLLPPYLYCQPCDQRDNIVSVTAEDFSFLDPSLFGRDTLPSISEDGLTPDDLPFAELNLEEDNLTTMNNTTSKKGAAQQEEASTRAEQYARSFKVSFGLDDHPSNGRSCFGHKESIYDVQFSECGAFLATASQDATIRVWDAATNVLLSTLQGHNKDSECLRVAWASNDWSKEAIKRNGEYKCLLASGAADGVLKVWASADASKKDSFKCISTIDHRTFEGRPKKLTEQDGSEDPPQVYALQFIDHWKDISDGQRKNCFLLSSSDDFVHLWDVEKKTDGINLAEVLSVRFTPMNHMGYGVSIRRVTDSGLDVGSDADQTSYQISLDGEDTQHINFGGDRNPDNLVFVFDAAYCEGNGLLGVALSDGSVRLVNGRAVCVSVLTLPGCQSHLTALAWDRSGGRLASCTATGHLIFWSTSVDDGDSNANLACEAVLEGGHLPGRPLYGAEYIGLEEEEEESLIVSWGADGRLCLWDAFSKGNISEPVCTLVSQADYPLFASDVAQGSTDGQSDILCRLALGGGREGGFMGIPAFLYDIKKQEGQISPRTTTTASNKNPGRDG